VGKGKKVVNKLKEPSMTKPIPRIGEGEGDGEKKKTCVSYIQNLEKQFGKCQLHLYWRPIINSDSCYPTYARS